MYGDSEYLLLITPCLYIKKRSFTSDSKNRINILYTYFVKRFNLLLTSLYHIMVYLLLPDLLSYITQLFFSLRKNIGDPTHSFTISHNLLMSGFYSGKGKKAVYNVEESVKSKSSSDNDSDNDLEIKKAIALSLQKDKIGESSKNIQGSPEKDEFEIISGYTQSWKTLTDRFQSVARKHNVLQEKLNKQTTKDESDLVKLSKGKEETNQLKAEISFVENKLSQYGIDPSEQFNYKPDSDSDYSSYSSDTSLKNKDYSSDNSEARPKKRVKYLNPNRDMTLVFPIYNIVISSTYILRFLSAIASGVFLLLVHLNILPNLIVPLININLADLLSLYLTINLIKLMYKMYNTILMIYNSYLNKDYMIIYTNIVLSIIIILLCFTSYNDVSIFYI
jgi:hypothetical protein